MVHDALRFGERPGVAYVLPISVDGMLIVASTAMVDDQRAGRPVRWSARVAFIGGIGASVAANIAAAQPSHGARIVAAWPAVALLLVVEMLSRGRRPPASPAPDHEKRGPDGAALAETDQEESSLPEPPASWTDAAPASAGHSKGLDIPRCQHAARLLRRNLPTNAVLDGVM